MLHGPSFVAALLLAGGLSIARGTWSEPPRPEDAPRNLDLEYAQAKLQLAEANLRRAEAMNKKVANAVSANVVAEYQQDVAVGQHRVASAEQGKGEDFQVWLGAARRNAAAAKNAWQSAVAANKRTKGTIDPTDVERLRLRAELLQLNYERGQQLATQPREVQLEWRVSALSDDVERLADVVLRNAPSRPGYPSVWYYYAY